MRLLVVLFCVLAGAHFVCAQESATNPDSTDIVNARQDVKEKLHSPKRAALYEALVPGLGHIYNKKAWHIPITYAAFGATVYLIIDNTKKYKKYKNAYADFSEYRKFLSQSPQYPLPIAEPSSQRFREVLDADYFEFSDTQLESFQQALKNNKDSFRRYRDLSYISLAGLYILNIIWAVTDAHFFYYDVSDDLSLQLQPQLLVLEDYRQGFGVNVVLNF